MLYLHEEFLENNLMRRWANKVADIEEDGYDTPTYKVYNITTNEYYAEAIDLVNSRRIEMGLEPYYYEVTDIPVEPDEEEETNEGEDNEQ